MSQRFAREWLWFLVSCGVSFVVMLFTAQVDRSLSALLLTPWMYLGIGAVRLTVAAIRCVSSPESRPDVHPLP